MKFVKILLCIMTLSACALSQIGLFRQTNMEILKSAIDKYDADGGMYLIVDAKTKEPLEKGSIKFDRTKPFYSHNLVKLYMLTAGLNSGVYTKKDIYFNDHGKEFSKKLKPKDKTRIFAELGLQINPKNTYIAEKLLLAYLNVFNNEENLLTANQLNMLKKAVKNNVVNGPAKNANVAGAEVSGLTSTTTKEENHNEVITQFTGTFSANDHIYGIITVLDNPKGIKETYGFKSAGWNAVPLARDIIKNIKK